MIRGLHSFRGERIGLLGCSEQERMLLMRQLGRFGAASVRIDALDDSHIEGPDRLKALFLDADVDLSDHVLPPESGRKLAIIALVGSEAPSHLNRVLKHSISAHLMKPIRSVGVFTALCVARQTFHTHSALADEIDKLSERLKRRRFVFAAQLRLMNDLGISEAAAFARLRGAAMERRSTIEDISLELLAGSPEIVIPR